MRNTTIPGTRIRTSRLGLGTASLHHVLGSSARQRLLAHAWHHGVRYFDTAPLYGHGLAERELGRFAAGRRSEMILATKAGILPSAWLARWPMLMYARMAAGAAARKVGGGTARFDMPRRDYGGSSTLRQVEHSLKALGTDYIDVLFLHEPALASIPNPDELGSMLDRLRQDGVIRHFGISGGGRDCVEIAARLPVLGEILQVEAREASGGVGAVRDAGRDVQVTFGHLREARKARRGATREKAVAVRACLARAVEQNPDGVILFSSRNSAHVDELISGLASVEQPAREVG